MICVAVDLGTTNIKAAAYTESLQRVALVQKGVVYRRTENQVEFDAEDYFETVFDMICGVAKAAIPAEKKRTASHCADRTGGIVCFAGQAYGVAGKCCFLDGHAGGGGVYIHPGAFP